MDEIERYQHMLHARTSGFKRKVEWAKKVLDKALEKDVFWYLAFSGGVDSTALLHLIFEERQAWKEHQIPILFGDDGFDYPETLDFLDTIQATYDLGIDRIRCLRPWYDWCEEMGRPDLAGDPQALAAWGNPHEWNETWQSLKDAVGHGYKGTFLGLLASESRSRSYALHDGYKLLYQVKSEHGMWHCSPLARWTKQDVWSYIVSRELPYNPVYDRLAELGLSLERRRVAPLTCFRTVQYGSVVALKSGWPLLFNRLTEVFPRVREYS